MNKSYITLKICAYVLTQSVICFYSHVAAIYSNACAVDAYVIYYSFSISAKSIQNEKVHIARVQVCSLRINLSSIVNMKSL